MSLITALILALAVLFTGTPTEVAQPTDTVVSSEEQDAWASFEALKLDKIDAETDTINDYSRTVDNTKGFRTEADEFPVPSASDPNRTHIFKVFVLHHA